MNTEKKAFKIVPIEDDYEGVFWNLVDQDPIEYYFFILDWRERRQQTKILLAFENGRIQGSMLLFADTIVQLRGTRKAVQKLIENVEFEEVELQAPLNCEDIVVKRYAPEVKHELMLMSMKRGEEKIQITSHPVRLCVEDAEQVSRLLAEADPVWWGKVTIESWKTSLKDTYWLGVKEGNRIVSAGNTRFTDVGSNIGVIATDESYRNRGYATSIVSALV